MTVPAGFAVWITGLPASGKSTLARALVRALEEAGVSVEVLESDALRESLTPTPRYTDEERELFYAALAQMGVLLTRHGVPVVIDATAHRRRYRDRARERIEKFVEVFVDCPIEVCASRDPKGIYRGAATGRSATVPGLQSPYEKPERPEIVVRGDREAPGQAARRVMEVLRRKGYLPTPAARG